MEVKKLYQYADVALIDKVKLMESTTKSPLTAWADVFPKTANKYNTYKLISGNRHFITITHANTANKAYIYTAHIDILISLDFFGVIFGACANGDYHAHTKQGGCGYDKHNFGAFGLVRDIGIEPIGNTNCGGIYGGGADGSKKILESIGNYLYNQFNIETEIISE